MRYVFCPKCGGRLSTRAVSDEGVVPFCSDCRRHFFPQAKPCVLVLVTNDRKEVALLRQPYVSKTHWVLVAGLNRPGETAEETVTREVQEETGLSVEHRRYVASYYHSKSDGLMLGFLAQAGGSVSAASSEVTDIRWAPFEQVPRFLRDGSTGFHHWRNVRDVLAP